MNEPAPSRQQPSLNRRRLQFSLRSLLLFVLVFSIACSWFGVRLRKAERQRAVVEEFEKAGGWVSYDFEPPGNSVGSFYPRCRPVPPYPAWLVKQLGIDFLSNVTEVVYLPTHMRAMNCYGPSPPEPPAPDLDILMNVPSLHTLSVAIRDNADFEKIGKLTRLENLNIIAPKTDVPFAEDDGFVHLRSLTRLRAISLSAFHLGSGLEHLAALPQLRELEISVCQFPWTERMPEPGVLLPDEENRQTRKAVASLAPLEQVESLRFNNTVLTDMALAWIARCTGVRRVTFCRDNPNDDAMRTIAGLPHLEELDLLATFDETAMARLREIPRLRKLTLDNANVHDADLKQLQELRHLERLDLSNNPISGEGLAYLKELPRLRSLVLNISPITDSGAEKLCTLNQVTDLKLNIDCQSAGSKVSEKAVSALRKAFPNCRDLDNWRPPAEVPSLPSVPEESSGTSQTQE